MIRPIPLLTDVAALPFNGSETEVGKTAESFESLFLYMLLEPLEKTNESFMGDGPEGRTFGNLYRQQLADQIASSRPLGIADQIEKSVARNSKQFDPRDHEGIQAYQLQLLQSKERDSLPEEFKEETP